MDPSSSESSRYDIPSHLERPSNLFRYLFVVHNCCLLVFMLFSAVVVYCVKGFLFHKKSKREQRHFMSSSLLEKKNSTLPSSRLERQQEIIPSACQHEEEQPEEEGICDHNVTSSDPSTPMTTLTATTTTTTNNSQMHSPSSVITIHSVWESMDSISPISQNSTNTFLNKNIPSNSESIFDREVNSSLSTRSSFQFLHDNHCSLSISNFNSCTTSNNGNISQSTIKAKHGQEEEDIDLDSTGAFSPSLNVSCNHSKDVSNSCPCNVPPLEHLIYNRLRDPTQFLFESFGFKFPITISLYLYRMIISMWALISLFLKQFHFEKQLPLMFVSFLTNFTAILFTLYFTGHVVLGFFYLVFFSKLYRNSKKIGIPTLRKTNLEYSNLRKFMLMASNGMWLMGEIAITSSLIVSVGYWIMFSIESSSEVSYL
ncbi:hypothetical protein FDP41_002657 [Naegleria fowleri]|uniref:Uncharacterized protein n=1 Tax=Naegleria fowleri TaxID=5763 RepID=A0A6A5BTT3_NAEFO|nr:uncharacterized protein FDP41_002657 [Naegleria fowleri]KAF0978142.1 hypothetical protein FDP41_002657 [Naegleria fowleri]